MNDLWLGFVSLAVGVGIWSFLDRHPLGRALQVIVTATAYLIWFSVVPLTIYFVGKAIADQIAVESYGKATFIAFASLTFIPIILFTAIPWNYFCLYVWRKVGLKLPQNSRLGGARQYYESERQQ